mgnify:CR=1 FL=1
MAFVSLLGSLTFRSGLLFILLDVALVLCSRERIVALRFSPAFYLMGSMLWLFLNNGRQVLAS